MPDEPEQEDPLATILHDYAGLEGLGRTGRIIRELVAEVRKARSERDEARSFADDYEALVEHSRRMFHDSTMWESDEDLGPQWQAMWNRHTWPAKKPA